MQYPDFIFYLCVRRKNLHVMSFNSTDEYQKFETLFKQYYSGLVVYASRFTGNTENAEDLVHDLFIHIWEDNRILGTDHIKAYLFTSIRHRCMNYLDHLKIRNEYQEKILQKRDITGMLTGVPPSKILPRPLQIWPYRTRRASVMMAASSSGRALTLSSALPPWQTKPSGPCSTTPAEMTCP